MRRLKKEVVVTGLVAVIAVCFGYPAISSFVNSSHDAKTIQGYTSATSTISAEQTERILQEADEYNQHLLTIDDPLSSKESLEGYSDCLNVQGDMMGVLEIPVIKLKLPIYHGTTSNSLEKGIGHMAGSSLPCGGDSTHAVLSAHNGMSDRNGFTDLELLKEGDTFKITVLDRTLTYQVDRIKTVLPDETENLEVVEGEDLVTLLTCTPYGINTHRLLVRGHRIENIEEPETVNVIRLNTKEKMIIGTLAVSAVIVAVRLVSRRKVAH